MPENLDILELQFKGNGIDPSKVKPHEIAELINSFEKALLFAIKQQRSEIDIADTVLFSFEAIRNESLDLRFIPRTANEAVLSAYFLISTCIGNNNYIDLNNASLKELRAITKFSKKYNCIGYFTHNDTQLSSFDASTEIEINKSKIRKEQTAIFGKIIDVGGENPNIHIKINDSYILIFKTSEENVKILAPRIYTYVKLIGEATWDVETFQILNFKLFSINDYVSGNTSNSINELRSLTSGFWDKFNTNDEINDQLLRD
jgi:hypothetical protein